MTRKIPNLIIVAGNGRNSGKTTMCRRIIMESGVAGITAVKISHHFHEETEGLVLLSEKEGFSIYEETNRGNGKDSSEMLRCGAAKAYLIKVTDELTEEAFAEVLRYIQSDGPVICESPSLIRYFEPGVLIIMVSPDGESRKDISEMKKHPHIEFTLKILSETDTLPIRWAGNKWICT
jgi:dephospho-CoA kinase